MNAAHLSVARRVFVDVAFVWGTGRVVLLFAVLLEAILWTTLIATGIWTGPPEVS